MIGTKSFMEKEILLQNDLLPALVERFVKNGEIAIDLPTDVKKIHFIASGSSAHCSDIAQRFFRDIAGFDTKEQYSSEFLSEKSHIIDKETLYYFVSQSGETTDTLNILRFVKSKGAKTFALVNNENSTMFKEADYKVSVEVGEEKSIAATKSLSACVVCAWLCAVKCAKNPKQYLNGIEKLKPAIGAIFNNQGQIQKAAEFLSTQKSFPIVSYDYGYALAKEGALKTKETSYTDTNAYPLGEFIHGHIALLNKVGAILEIFTHEITDYEKAGLNKIKNEYNPKIVAITDFDTNLPYDYKIVFEQSENDLIKVISILLILQLLALNIAYNLKADVDNPKGLCKVVQY